MTHLSCAISACEATKPSAPVRPDMRAIIAGGTRRVARTEARPMSSASDLQNEHIAFFTGRRARDVAVKAEQRSAGPSAPKKRKIHSTTDATPIGHTDPINVDFGPTQASRKQQTTVASGSSCVQLDDVMPPPKQQPSARPTRKSTRVTKSVSKKEM